MCSIIMCHWHGLKFNYIYILQFFPIWNHKIFHSVNSSVQKATTNQQNEENYIWEHSSKVNNLEKRNERIRFGFIYIQILLSYYFCQMLYGWLYFSANLAFKLDIVQISRSLLFETNICCYNLDLLTHFILFGSTYCFLVKGNQCFYLGTDRRWLYINLKIPQ